jgi:hypothetical protein
LFRFLFRMYLTPDRFKARPLHDSFGDYPSCAVYSRIQDFGPISLISASLHSLSSPNLSRKISLSSRGSHFRIPNYLSKLFL